MKLFFGIRTEGHMSHEHLSAYVDGELRGADLRRLEKHLLACERCVDDLEGLRETVYALRAVPLVPAPRTFSVPRAMVPDRAWRPATAWGIQAVGVAAVVALAVVVTGALTGSFGVGGPQAPVQVGMAEPAPLISSVGQPDPEAAVPVGEQSLPPAEAIVTDVPGDRSFAWALPSLGLAAVAGILVTIVVRCRQSALR